MKRNSIKKDPLEGLFAAARGERIPDDGFTRRVVGRLGPLPPSKNLYRIPTLATAFASVLLLVWVAASGFDFSGIAERWRSFDGEVKGIRLVPATWRFSSNTDTEASEGSATPFPGGIKFR